MPLLRRSSTRRDERLAEHLLPRRTRCGRAWARRPAAAAARRPRAGRSSAAAGAPRHTRRRCRGRRWCSIFSCGRPTRASCTSASRRKSCSRAWASAVARADLPDRDGQDAQLLPGFKGPLPRPGLGVQIAIGEEQLPIGVLHLRHELRHRRLEIGQADVGVDPRDQHAVVEAGNVGRPGDPVEIDARTLQQVAGAARPRSASIQGRLGSLLNGELLKS